MKRPLDFELRALAALENIENSLTRLAPAAQFSCDQAGGEGCRYWFLAISIFLATTFFSIAQTAIAQEPSLPKLEGYDLTFPAMGSTITLSAYSDSEAKVERAFSEVRREIDRLVLILSDYESNSELNRLYLDASTAKPLSDELFEVLVASEAWHRRSAGAFDAAIGNLTKLWRDARKRRELPSQTQIDDAIRHSGWQRVQLNKIDRTLTLLDPKVRIDLGGIAAGYIVDRAFDILVAHGLTHSLVNDGGDIRCGQAPPGREGWRIEVASMSSTLVDKRKQATDLAKTGFQSSTISQNASPPLRRIFLKNAAITTSGDLWQFIEIEGKRRSHILDPKTGYGVLGPSVVAVIAPTCIEADAAATAVSVLGTELGLALIAQYPSLEALFASRLSEANPFILSVTPGFPPGIFESTPSKSR